MFSLFKRNQITLVKGPLYLNLVSQSRLISRGEQLQKTDQTVYRIDRIIRKRGTEVLVKWSGYPDKFSSWIPETDVLQSGRELTQVE